MRENQYQYQDTTTSSTTSTTSSMTSNSLLYSQLSFDLALAKSNSENLSLLKPHRSSESAFEAIVSSTAASNRPLTFRDFNLIRKVGSGDISTVYLCRLRSDDKCEYAMKVVDKEALALKNKTQRAEMEKKILNMLDHPFLPTLYAQFDASHFSCIVMEYCSGGDLYSLRSRLPNKRFPLHSARFYAAEVLVALEYLHMLGIIYRDLKPENVLVRSDGHIMLSDFDLSLCSDSIPAVQWPDDPTSLTPFPPSSPTPAHTKSPPFFACLPYTRLFRSKKIQTLTNNKLFVAEPISARSSSFVGTHEYITPEVASGNSHGNAVDWWALGIFIYEMIYGRTPFKGPSNVATLRNILKKPLAFPTSVPSCTLEGHARDLIKGLLKKDPVSRVGFTRGAADIKTHPFFKGLNFALIRSVAPPLVPGSKRSGSHKHLFDTTSFKEVTVTKKKESSPYDFF